MYPEFTIIPRYQLDDTIPWLEGVDPLGNYWIAVNGDRARQVSLAGIKADSFEAFKQIMHEFRSLQSGESMFLGNGENAGEIICINDNCYAYVSEMNNVPVWHLFDQESLDSLLMTAHPDWQCSHKDLQLGRSQLEAAWEQTAVA